MDHIAGYLEEVRALLSAVPETDVRRTIEAIVETWQAKRTIWVFGNGGSAATASHFACDLGKGTRPDRASPFRVVALTDNVPLMTAWGNDVSYDDIFANQLEGWVEAGDLVIGISTSGQSKNVLKAMLVARAAGARTVGLIGFDGGQLKNLVDIAVVVPGHHISQCEDVHHALQHLICVVLSKELGENGRHIPARLPVLSTSAPSRSA